MEKTKTLIVGASGLVGSKILECVSKKYNKRLLGLIAVAMGSILAMIVQLYAGLYYFFFASAFWLLNSAHAIRKMIRANREIF